MAHSTPFGPAPSPTVITNDSPDKKGIMFNDPLYCEKPIDPIRRQSLFRISQI